VKAYRDSEALERRIVAWLQERGASSGRKGCVFGLSGGIDSAVVAGLARKAFGRNILGVLMPCHSNPQDAEDALKVAEALDIPTMWIDLSRSYDTLLEAFPGEETFSSSLALANIKPRLRMLTLYAVAQERGFLVCGTGNKIELTVGYFTKHGDSGVDLLPLGDLLKGEVRALADHLGVPRDIIVKPPSAGLWEGQTDEKEMGYTYQELDNYFLEQPVSQEVQSFVEEAYRRSEHKRQMPPLCEIGETE
jgi:NAD+ synthase